MVAYLDEMKSISMKIKDFKIHQIPRKENRKADALANLGDFHLKIVFQWNIQADYFEEFENEVKKIQRWMGIRLVEHTLRIPYN